MTTLDESIRVRTFPPVHLLVRPWTALLFAPLLSGCVAVFTPPSDIEVEAQRTSWQLVNCSAGSCVTSVQVRVDVSNHRDEAISVSQGQFRFGVSPLLTRGEFPPITNAASTCAAPKVIGPNGFGRCVVTFDLGPSGYPVERVRPLTLHFTNDRGERTAWTVAD